MRDLGSLFEEVMRGYPAARRDPFGSEHEMYELVVRTIPALLKARTPAHPGMQWKGSVGKGQWSDSPWIAAFDPVVTTTPQDGYYVVYLFTRSLSGVYLSMNQGMTRLKKAVGAVEARRVMREQAARLRLRLTGQFERRFSGAEIDLEHAGNSTRLAFYEPGHALGCRYERGAVPEAEDVVADANGMLKLYREAIFLGGVADLEVRDDDISDLEVGPPTQTERRQVRIHKTIERNSGLARAAKRVHGCICQACGFDFEEHYGPLGHGYIEAHHRIPLSQAADAGVALELSPRDDFAVVCANCHRMLHRQGAPTSFEEFASLVRETRKGSS